MNMSRGLLRLWIIFSLLFAATVIVYNFGNLTHPKSAFDPTNAELVLPIDCSQARGQLDKNYTHNQTDTFCWYRLSEFRNLYPEYRDLTDESLSEKLYKSMQEKSQPDNLFREALNNILIYGIGLPLSLLVFGLCLRWALKGFKN